MVTVTNNSTADQLEIFGLSTDTKPTIADYPSMRNGSSFLEMDTKKIYFYDSENAQWV